MKVGERKKGILGLLTMVVFSLLVVFVSHATNGKSASSTKEEKSYQIGQVTYAAHGTNSFAIATVVLQNGEVIQDSVLDEFQYFSSTTEGLTPVPNIQDLEAHTVDDMVLASKIVNSSYYSNQMKDKAGSTKVYTENIKEIVAFTKGKTITELEEFVSIWEVMDSDAISGATLVDKVHYVEAILEAAKQAKLSSNRLTYTDEEVESSVLNMKLAGPHSKCFAMVSVWSNHSKILLSYLDEFAYMDKETSKGVPNSEGMAKSIAETFVLGSKRDNSAAYSAHMQEVAKGTVAIDQNYNAIQTYANGKNISELKTWLEGQTKETVTDAVSGATLVDTQGYLRAIVEVAVF
ncbi:hypothetical protein FACS189418_6110 [Clostridia bacterium]|nr:hypothetical protein FACS189418_6110 [Clostridia bacterium]